MNANNKDVRKRKRKEKKKKREEGCSRPLPPPQLNSLSLSSLLSSISRGKRFAQLSIQRLQKNLFKSNQSRMVWTGNEGLLKTLVKSAPISFSPSSCQTVR